MKKTLFSIFTGMARSTSYLEPGTDAQVKKKKWGGHVFFLEERLAIIVDHFEGRPLIEAQFRHKHQRYLYVVGPWKTNAGYATRTRFRY